MAGFKNSHDDSGALADINITPFVDVMLVLLIIFMVATPLMESGIPLQLPKANTKSLPRPEDPVILSLNKDSLVFIGKESIALESLPSRLKSAFANRTAQEIFIRADSSLPYGFVAKVMATVKNSGINKIGLVTEETKE